MRYVFWLLLLGQLVSSAKLTAITLYTQSSGSWTTVSAIATPNLFNTQADGSGTYYNGNDPIAFLDPSTDIVIQTGHVVDLYDSVYREIGNLTIETDAQLWNSFSRVTIEITKGILVVDGQMGNGLSTNGIYLIFSQSNQADIQGNGVIDILRLYNNNLAGSNMDIGVNLNIYENSGGIGETFWHFTGGDVTIGSGTTVNVYGNFALDNDAYDNFFFSNVTDGFVLFVDGTLNVMDGQLMMRTDNSAGDLFNMVVSGSLYTEHSIYAMGSNADPNPVGGSISSNLYMYGFWETEASDPIIHDDPSRFELTTAPFSTVKFSGPANQIIEGTSVYEGTYGTIELAGSGNKVLGGDLTISQDLIFTSGGVELGNFDLTFNKNIFFNVGSPYIGYNENKYLKTNGTGTVTDIVFVGSVLTAQLIPIGNSTYNPVEVFTTGSGVSLSFRVDDAHYQNGNNGPTTTNGVVNRTWYVSTAQSNVRNIGANLTFYWSDDEEMGDFDRTSSYVSHYENNAWDVSSPTQLGTDPSGMHYVARGGIDSFSPFSVMNTTASLPVELISFSGKDGNDGIKLEWETASETNNAFFLLEHQLPDGRFDVIHEISGRGDTQELTKYHYTHANPYPGVNYYRLKQVDFDGKFTYSSVIAVQAPDNLEENQLIIFPTTTSDKIYLKSTSHNFYGEEVIISNALGQEVKRFPKNTTAFDVASLEEGSYYLILRGAGKKIVKPFMKID